MCITVIAPLLVDCSSNVVLYIHCTCYTQYLTVHLGRAPLIIILIFAVHLDPSSLLLGQIPRFFLFIHIVPFFTVGPICISVVQGTVGIPLQRPSAG